jgi:hypothetical protein
MRREQIAELSFRPAIVRHFGSVDAALVRADLAGWPVRVREQTLSATVVIKALRARRRAGLSTRASSVQQESHLLWFSATVHFGTWSGALAVAKIENEAPGSWTRDEILEALRARVARNQSIKTTIVEREEPALYAAAKKHFGGYVAAAREVDGAPWATIDWTPQLIIEELRKLRRKDRRVTAKSVGSRIASAAERYFGTFTAARRAAGID